MARLRAVVVIQPPGFGGSPVSGHRSLATRNASWTISSAMSMSPKRRTRVATTLPDSSRKIRSRSVARRPARSVRTRARLGTGAPRPGPMQAAEPLAAHASAASRSGASMIQKPPSCSFVSANGPSVMSGSPSVARTTVADAGSCRPPAKTQAPAAWSSALNASTCLNAFCITSGSVGDRVVGAVPDGQEVLGHFIVPFGRAGGVPAGG